MDEVPLRPVAAKPAGPCERFADMIDRHRGGTTAYCNQKL